MMPPGIVPALSMPHWESASHSNLRKRRACFTDEKLSNQNEPQTKRQIFAANTPLPNSLTRAHSAENNNLRRRVSKRCRGEPDALSAHEKRMRHNSATPRAASYSFERKIDTNDEPENVEDAAKVDSCVPENCMLIPYPARNLPPPKPVQYAISDRVIPKLIEDWKPTSDINLPMVFYRAPPPPPEVHLPNPTTSNPVCEITLLDEDDEDVLMDS